jgi:hypothetical protein
MPSPFPGMDPYIETSGLWPDFHATMLSAMRADLNANLPAGYAASIEIYVWADEVHSRAGSKIMEPNIHVRKEKRATNIEAATAILSPPSKTILPRLAQKKRKYVKIIDIKTRQVVTAIELLSPSNKKKGDDRTRYLEKRNEYLANNLNFIEIDLLRGGHRPPLGRTASAVTKFYAMVCRSWEFPEAGVWTFGVRDRLPDIPVPVTQDLQETPLHLSACVARAFDEGRYAESLPYDEPLIPPPDQHDLDWFNTILANYVK